LIVLISSSVILTREKKFIFITKCFNSLFVFFFTATKKLNMN